MTVRKSIQSDPCSFILCRPWENRTPYKNMCQIIHETKILHTGLSYQNVQELEMGQHKNKNVQTLFDVCIGQHFK